MTTVVIGPFDEPTRCAQSVFTDLQPLRFGYAVFLCDDPFNSSLNETWFGAEYQVGRYGRTTMTCDA